MPASFPNHLLCPAICASLGVIDKVVVRLGFVNAPFTGTFLESTHRDHPRVVCKTVFAFPHGGLESRTVPKTMTVSLWLLCGAGGSLQGTPMPPLRSAHGRWHPGAVHRLLGHSTRRPQQQQRPHECMWERHGGNGGGHMRHGSGDCGDVTPMVVQRVKSVPCCFRCVSSRTTLAPASFQKWVASGASHTMLNLVSTNKSTSGFRMGFPSQTNISLGYKYQCWIGNRCSWMSRCAIMGVHAMQVW